MNVHALLWALFRINLDRHWGTVVLQRYNPKAPYSFSYRMVATARQKAWQESEIKLLFASVYLWPTWVRCSGSIMPLVTIVYASAQLILRNRLPVLCTCEVTRVLKTHSVSLPLSSCRTQCFSNGEQQCQFVFSEQQRQERQKQSFIVGHH